MSTRRTTHDKRQRERSKQQKAAAKREKRQDKTSDDQVEVADAPFDAESTEALIARMEELHANYDAGRVSFEDFDEQKAELLDRIALKLAQ